MEGFIKKILDLDEEAKHYSDEVSSQKITLQKENEKKLSDIEDKYKTQIENLKQDFENQLKELEKTERAKLVDFENKAEEMGKEYKAQKADLLEKMSKFVLESGD
ncbi:hypothetical protein [Criibacterium bergeronii]|uniref:Uncharacterized protein n=1 Tax=Criibacterium bergeronii TaxID=1871336 RepID=A0A371IIV1_9FIRM|nr:hypothetical protein [Criibacterium bergeronii]MBS6063160.1 hypothetical protein [Peptostreptococcaceae bacterium]RDY20411.1 hypothetical protein BBG48_010165 [Criibacterium bergeronii]